MLLPRHQANYDSILVVDRLKKILRDEPVQIPIDAPGLAEVFIPFDSRSATKTHSSPSSGARDTTFRFGYGYTPLRSTAVAAHTSLTKKISALAPDSIRNLMTACRKNLPHWLDIANPFPPDLLGYVHEFSY